MRILEKFRVGAGGIAGQVFWGIGDQGFSSLTNAGLGVLVARSVSARTFGAFSIMFAAYAVVLNVGNGLFGEPFLMRYSNLEDKEWRDASAAACGAALVLGFVSGALCLLIGLIVGGSFRSPLMALAITLPGLTLQDTWRTAFFARPKAQAACINDLIWTAVLIPALVVVIMSGHQTVFWLVIAWGGAATVAAGFGCFQARLIPRPSLTLCWLRDNRAVAPRLLGEMMVWSGEQQATLYAVGLVAGLEVVGGLRGAELLLGPIYIVILGTRVVGVPKAITILERSTRQLRRWLVTLSVCLAMLALATGFVTSVMPARLGTAFLGKTWLGARPALIPTGLFMAALGVSMSARIGLRALQSAKRSFRARLFTAPIVVLGGIIGATVGGTRAAAYGIALGALFECAYFWRQLDRAIADFVAASEVIRPTGLPSP